jgi:hypothetical protein
MKLLVILGLFLSGIAYAGQQQRVYEFSLEEQYCANRVHIQSSHWYCVAESPGNMQSSGHIGYGHGKTCKKSARRAIEACQIDGGFGQCGNLECFPE